MYNQIVNNEFIFFVIIFHFLMFYVTSDFTKRLTKTAILVNKFTNDGIKRKKKLFLLIPELLE